MRFTLKHQRKKDLQAAYGWDHAIGFFVVVSVGKMVTAEYDALHPGYADLEGACRFLIEHGFYTEDDYEEAASNLPHQSADEMPKKIGRVGKVIENFRKAAD